MVLIDKHGKGVSCEKDLRFIGKLMRRDEESS